MRVRPALFQPCLAVALLLSPAMAGCSGGNFQVELNLWSAGYAWEYNETLSDSIEVEGEAPDSLAGTDDGEGRLVQNRTLRIEIFNSTAASVEGLPIYAAAVLARTYPDNESLEAGEEITEAWDVWIYSADLNLVEPTYVDWRNQEVQLSGEDGGVSESEEASNDTANQPENEQRLLDWPLSKNKRWRHAERVAELESDGVFDGRVVGKGSTRVKAGNFETVRIRGTLEPLSTEEIEDAIRQSMESQGGEVDSLRFGYEVDYEYTYSEKVLNFVTYKETKRITLRAEGKDEDGAAFDFKYTQSREIERRLSTYQLEVGVEKPLTFALDVERGAYAPKPITPASHLAVEIVATQQALNRQSEEKVTFGVRIFNSTAGEKRLRGIESTFPHVLPSSQIRAEYDHSYLEIVWELQSVDRRNNFHTFRTQVADELTLKAADFPSEGWKQVRATLRLKNAQNTTDPTIFTDQVAFEVYYHLNHTVSRAAGNLTPGQTIRTSFPVEPSATRITVKGVVQNTPPETHCVIAGTQDCIAVFDSGNRRVADDRSTRMEFETTRAGSYNFGTWSAEYQPNAPSQTVVFEIVVRYRFGA